MTDIHFGTDGVRGKAGTWPINAAGALQIGYGVGHFLRQQSESAAVVIGRDTRLSGDMLTAAVSAGLLAAGVDVLDVGVMTTAGVAFLTVQHQLQAGIVISASHNPWEQNGIKVLGPGGLKMADDAEREMEAAIAEAIDAEPPERSGRLTHRPADVDLYINHLVNGFADNALAGFKIALDCSNGAASAIAPRCFERLGAELTVLHADPDGTNINRECGSEALRDGDSDLKRLATKESLTFGAAFDGDADRVAMVDENGALIDGDHILYMLAMDLTEKIVVTTTMANRGLDAALEPHGVRTVRTPVGDKYIVQEILEKDYRLGGEQSGHILIYDEMHPTGDGIYTALLIARILAENPGQSLSQLAAPLIKFPQVIASAEVESKPALDGIDALAVARATIADQLGDDAVINIRYSGTESLIRVMIESSPEHTLDELAADAVKLCRTVQAAAGQNQGWMEVKNCVTGDVIDIAEIS